MIPIPEELNITAGSVGAKGSAEQVALEAAENSNLEKYGAANWYDFCVNRWGTKWDVELYDSVEPDADGTSLTMSFDSAWSPPIGIYEALMEDGFSVDATYHEPGMCFCGRWQNGDDDFVDYSGCTSANAREVVGEYLDDEYGISDWLADCESENEEDE